MGKEARWVKFTVRSHVLVKSVARHLRWRKGRARRRRRQDVLASVNNTTVPSSMSSSGWVRRKGQTPTPKLLPYCGRYLQQEGPPNLRLVAVPDFKGAASIKNHFA